MNEQVCPRCRDVIRWTGKGNNLKIESVKTGSILTLHRESLTKSGVNDGGLLAGVCSGEGCLARKLYDEKWSLGQSNPSSPIDE